MPFVKPFLLLAFTLPACASRVLSTADGSLDVVAPIDANDASWSDASWSDASRFDASRSDATADAPAAPDEFPRFDVALPDHGATDSASCTPDSACLTTCGSEGTRRCGEPAACVVPPERCDGDDDDCDEAIDNGLTTLGRDFSLGESWGPVEAAGLGDGDVGVIRETRYAPAAFSFLRIRGEDVVGTVPLYESTNLASSRTICALGGGRFDVFWGELSSTSALSPSTLWHSRVTHDDHASTPRPIYQTTGHFIVGTRVVCSEDGARLTWLEYRGSGGDVGGVVRTVRVTGDSTPGPAAAVEGIDSPVRDMALARIPGGYVLATTEFQAPYSRDRLTSVIHLRMYRDDGTLLRGPLPVTSEGSVGHGVRVAWTGRRIVAVWQTTWPEPSPAPPTVRAFALTGTPLMSAWEVPGGLGAVDLALTAVDGGAVLLWHGAGDAAVGRYAHHYLLLRDDGVRVGPMNSALRRGDPSTLSTLGVARGLTGLTLVDVSYAFRSPMAEDFYRLLPMEGCR